MESAVKHVRIPGPILEALEKCMEKEGFSTTSGAVVELLRRALKEEGYLNDR